MKRCLDGEVPGTGPIPLRNQVIVYKKVVCFKINSFSNMVDRLIYLLNQKNMKMIIDILKQKSFHLEKIIEIRNQKV